MGMCKHYKGQVCDLTNQRVSDSVKNNTCYTSSHQNCEIYKKNLKGGGCFITTAVCETSGLPDDCYELTMMRSFRDNWVAKQAGGDAVIVEYYDCAPSIVEAIDSLPEANTIWDSIRDQYITPCIGFLEKKDDSSCYELYQRMVADLKKQYCHEAMS